MTARAGAATAAVAGAFTGNATTEASWQAQATMAGAGAFTANATDFTQWQAQATMAGAGVFTADATTFHQWNAQATFSGAGAFSANALDFTQWQGQATFAGTGGFTAGAALIEVMRATFAGSGAFAADATTFRQTQAQAVFAGAGLFTADATVQPVQTWTAQATFAGAGAFTANATLAGATTWIAQAAFIGAGVFTADAQVQEEITVAANGRWQATIDTSASPTTHAIVQVTPPLVPIKGEQGFTLFFVSPTAQEFNGATEVTLVKPSGATLTLENERIYEGRADEFGVYIMQGTFVAFISRADDFDEPGRWSVFLSEDGVPISGRGYFTVMNA